MPALRRAYAGLLLAYPTAFRQEYGEEMAEVFTDLAGEAARGGIPRLLAFSLREMLHTLAAALRAHAMPPGSLARRAWEAFLRLFRPGEGPPVDGRASWRQAALEVSTFVLFGVLLAVNTYLPARWLPALARSAMGPLGALAVIVFLLWLFAGVARGMPRWAFPPLGLALAFTLFAGAALVFMPFYAWAAGAALILILMEALYASRRRSLPGAFVAFLRRLGREPTLASFGIYGVMPLALVIAFDDAYVNSHTLWYLAAVLGMVAGALLYTRSRAALLQTGSLALGVCLVFFAAVLDRVSFTRTGWVDRPWFFTLWANLLLIVLLPPTLGLLYRLLFRRRPPLLKGRGEHMNAGSQ